MFSLSLCLAVAAKAASVPFEMATGAPVDATKPYAAPAASLVVQAVFPPLSVQYALQAK